ncbi:MAG: HupE/UreJ family protein [Cyanobacteria bacterium KgW148]|nr:HupE/UreJ family protein [Cyanobacteria bacterium KgW148]
MRAIFSRSFRPIWWFSLAVLTVIFFPGLASAHVNAGETAGFMHGFLHPIGGLDHILAMVAVGLWAAQLGGKALWAVPLAFVGAMAIGGVLGIWGTPVPFVEPAIIASDLILGSLIVMATRLPLWASAGLVGFLAIFHGFAHGAEMPADSSGLLYSAGFMLATLGLHLSGMGAVVMLRQIAQDQQEILTRVAGGVVLLAGVYVLVNSFSS